MLKKCAFVVAMTVLLVGCGQPKQDISEPQAMPEAKPTTVYADTRIIFDLNAEEREHIIEEMHSFLAATEGVILGLSENDMSKVADAAYKVTPRGHERPLQELRKSIHEKMPEGFRPMTRSVRHGFRAIYETAKADGDATDIQAHLGKTLQICSACHATYQVPTK